MSGPNAPLESGEGVGRAMELALADADVSAREIGYLNAHATSTSLGDRAEAMAIRNAFGEHARKLAVSSTKSMTGHLLGGAGSLEAGFTVLALRDQMAPPTINFVSSEEDYGLDFVPNAARSVAVRFAMTNSFGFGGGNASLVFQKSE